ncbi:N-6 DNA methylase [Brachyspira hyodysenteriae]|uniref:Eco57I restriction-modification methylase domain-containing protein n=1 Tax=Brachyspira hyodysenteriae TaxID=159 RepID=UPI0022CD6700|nr:N-6 DNA methylase [Brachyspira hyodysenteriae]MCZ9876937.1 N-6 DNA methylase [Brachyspira hyodysenteriae]MCZ9891793.1 N-6 DNA methylase [Brachyspira hyodysenteriae]MCZ9933580.1 N-6 DNA methylase [Brachyspira hyodysenteriae]MCZ9944920.1 N-6 DNA methylase [Brachyspira hyodysenteriae]MCZ9946767.1 N-6 DNA methylase [Brachyspira hyodysenteriae]
MYSKEEVYKKVEELVIKFRNNKDQYTNKNYNETETRRDFLDPFFEAFGWDVSNRAGKSQTYRDVIHEDKVKVGKETKAPDYAFRIGGNRVFFVEAKKPGVNLKEDNLPAFQLRRYGWSAKLGISFLTDFEELAVYDCTRKPNVNDKASTARIEYIHFEDYLNRFDFLYEILNKERIEQGSLEKYIAGTSNKKGTESVDIDFLNSLDSLRTKLASNIAKLNKNLSVRDLNYAVQQIIDRIIFLRAAEDRGIEEYGDLKKTCENKGDNFYSNLLKIFEKADGRYNSGLFDFSKDSISSSIEIDNKVIKEIINELYYPLSPYEFSVISVEIIGNAYEQFLGKTITIGKNHSAKIELKPEVRKAGGVYYTPEYIVDYIVANTVGEAIKGKKPEEIANIKILDPACGSGSFLLGAYKYLLNYHIEYYNKIKDRAKFKGSKEDVIKENGDLTIWIKKQILRNNIFGVDIDSNAVEVTKLSLLMRCLEGESPASIQNNQDLFNERALPSLEDNIKCGNSLIGNDFYESHLDLDDDTLYKINCFDWNSKFRDIMKAGGFDVVIGNPPYVQIQGMEKELKEGYKEANYKNYVLTGDIYQLFFEKGLDVLKAGGIAGMITSNKWMRAGYGAVTRDYFYRNANVNGVIDLGAGRFQGATVDTSIILYSKNDDEIKINEPREFKAIKFYDDLAELENIQFGDDRVIANHDKEWVIMNNLENDIFDKIMKHKPLKDWGIQINYGIKTGFNEAFFIDEETKNNLIKEDAKSAELIKPLIRGRDVKKYVYSFHNSYIICTFPALKLNIDNYPAIKKYLKSFGKRLEQSGEKGCRKKTNNKWFETQDTIAYYEDFEKDKIVWTPVNGIYYFTYVEAGYYFNNSLFMIVDDDKNELKYLLAVLNTVTLKFGSLITPLTNVGQYTYGSKEFMQTIPIPEPDKDTESKLVNLVDNIIELNKKLSSEKNPNTIEMLNTRIQAVDKAIDKIVYALYGLNDEEIKIIEGE